MPLLEGTSSWNLDAPIITDISLVILSTQHSSNYIIPCARAEGETHTSLDLYGNCAHAVGVQLTLVLLIYHC